MDFFCFKAPKKESAHTRLKNMLVCRRPGLFFRVHPAGREKKLSFWDGKESINPYLLNLIFEFFAPLHFVCFHLQCAHNHYEFSLLLSTQSAISMLTTPWNLVSTTVSPPSVSVDEMMV